MKSPLGRIVLGTVFVLCSSSITWGQDPKPPLEGPAKPPSGETAKPAGETPKPPPAPAKPKPAAPLSLTVEVTDRSGNPLANVMVNMSGAVERSGSTGEDGTVVFRSLRAGTYRLRFEHDEFTPLEREVVVRAGQTMAITAALTPAPAPPAPPAPSEEPPPPAETPERPARQVEPRSLSIPDFLDKNLIGGEPQRTTLLACAEGGTARLLQIRDPLNNQEHADVDEVLYIVAGAGVVRIRNQDTKVGAGHFTLLPRGVPYSVRREGRNPLIALSVLTGEPCIEGAVPGP